MHHREDLHIHTRVSDGDNTFQEILDTASRLRLARISITDHDALGTYRRDHPIADAAALGIELVPGIELDTDYQQMEVHLLGYGIDIENAELNAHLARVQAERRQRIRLQAEALNRHFRSDVIDLSRIFTPERDTVMKPHLYRFLRQQELVDDYAGFRRLLDEHARVDAKVFRPTLPQAIELILHAGGMPVIAHPGYLKKHGIRLDMLVEEMIRFGLAGLETDYPYWNPHKPDCSHFRDQKSERAMIAAIRELASRFNLVTTRGSDAHDLETFNRFNRD
ncbi:MAG: PHP domain-containing protein [Acidobacteriota bacterium]|jgi:predicted metal-dependent phosphoesterase TrpH|nr:PHP domain-containing protein [Acidobacteriota bacterium]